MTILLLFFILNLKRGGVCERDSVFTAVDDDNVVTGLDLLKFIVTSAASVINYMQQTLPDTLSSKILT